MLIHEANISLLLGTVRILNLEEFHRCFTLGLLPFTLSEGAGSVTCVAGVKQPNDGALERDDDDVAVRYNQSLDTSLPTFFTSFRSVKMMFFPTYNMSMLILQVLVAVHKWLEITYNASLCFYDPDLSSNTTIRLQVILHII